MKKIVLAFTFLTTIVACKNNQQTCEPAAPDPKLQFVDSLAKSLKWPEELKINGFAGPAITPSPACIAAAATGEVYVGVDMMGSLGKKPGRGMIIRLVDCNNDGIVDSHTEYAAVDNPRGVLPMGDKLYVLHTVFKDTLATGMDLVVFEDKDRDGVADGPSKPLVEHISNPVYLQGRGTDHATNGIRMGIDGWIYIAVGDFGFHEAIDRDGKKLTMHGGGVVRVRPDGKEMEIFSHGTRNIYDVAIDPFMNIFTRDNTNDGGGWNIRFSHHIQSAEYGYPILFKHFTEEIIPAMIDLGGGSGTGSLFMDDPSWPEKFNHVPMMADWGRSEVYIHRVTASGGSFTQKEESFLKMPQVTDLDIDGSGRLYVAAWDGAGYEGDSSKGFVVRAVPANWQYKPFPDLKAAPVADLVALLKSEGAVARLNAQQELLSRNAKDVMDAVWSIVSDKNILLASRVAAMYTYAQVAGKDGIKNLVELSSDAAMSEFALRALADRKSLASDVPLEPFIKAIKDTSSPRAEVAAIIGLGRLGKMEAARELLQVKVPSSFVAPPKGVEGPHATPNTAIVPAHLAVHALVQLNAVDACVAAVNTIDSTIALWALRYMYDQKAVDGLIAAYNQTQSKNLKDNILTTLGRLYNKETPYDGSTWWSTRPDGHGPFYKPTNWEGSAKIKSFLEGEWAKSNAAGKQFFADLNGKMRMHIAEFGPDDKPDNIQEDEDVKVDFEKIKNKKGQIGQSSIEDIILAMDKIKGDPAKGKILFTQQGCVACHSTKKGEPLKGPFMGQIGSIMNRKQIAESILKPDASISQGFATVAIVTKDGKSFRGFVTGESSDKIILRDIAGKSNEISISNIQSRKELPASMMPVGLANALSYEEFASLITWLSQQK